MRNNTIKYQWLIQPVVSATKKASNNRIRLQLLLNGQIPNTKQKKTAVRGIDHLVINDLTMKTYEARFCDRNK